MKNDLYIETVLVRGRGEIPLLPEHYRRYTSTVLSSSSPNSSSTGEAAGENATEEVAAKEDAEATEATRGARRAGMSMEEFKETLLSAIPHPTPDAWRGVAESLWCCRLVYTESGRVHECTALPFVAKKLRRIGIIELTDATYPLKSADRHVFDNLRSQFPEHDEIIITRNGFLSDGTFTNIYLRRPGAELLTPADNLLDGCQRSRLIAEKLLVPARLVWDNLDPEWNIGFINALHPLGTLGEWPVGNIDNLGDAAECWC